MHRFIEVVLLSWSARIGAAFALISTALGLLWLGLTLVWSSETRVHLGDEAGKAVDISPRNPRVADGTFVSVRGAVTADQKIGDPEFLNDGDYIWLFRQTETFAWTEQVSSQSKQLWGGGQEVTTVTQYTGNWVSYPPESNEFKHPEGHENSAPAYVDALFTPRVARVGDVQFDPSSAVLLAHIPVPLNASTLRGRGTEGVVHENTLYLGAGTPDSPQIGDQRVRFFAVPAGIPLTLFGDLRGTELRGHDWLGQLKLLIGYPGEREEFMQLLESEYRIRGALMIVGGCALQWVGAWTALSPLYAVADVAPPLGFVVRGSAFVATGLFAVALTAVTHVATKMAHNVGVAILGLLFFAIAFKVWRDNRKFTEQRIEQLKKVGIPTPPEPLVPPAPQATPAAEPEVDAAADTSATREPKASASSEEKVDATGGNALG
jgi:hypothetical protein